MRFGHEQRRSAGGRASALAALVLTSGLGACAAPDGAAPSPGPDRAAASVAPDRVVHFGAPGSTTFVALRPAGAVTDPITAALGGWRPAGAPVVEWAGVELRSRLVALRARPVDGARWMSPPRRWSAASDLDGVAPGEIALWAVAFEVPSLEGSAPLRIAGRRVTVRPIPDAAPSRISARLPRPEAGVEARRALWRMLTPVAADATQRWRLRLIAERFTPTPEAVAALAPFVDADVAAIERQSASLALAGLAALEAFDPELGADVLAMLTAVVRTPDGDLLPAWSADSSAEAELFESMLDPGRSPRERRLDVDSFLGRRAPAVAWVIDESGVQRGGVSRIAVADLRGRPTVASCAPELEAARNATRLRGHESAVLRAGPGELRSGGTIRYLARCGPWSTSVRVVGLALPAGPPGLRTGPFFGEWTLASWLADSASPVDPAWRSAALLQRGPSGGGGSDSAGVAWELFVECRRAAVGSVGEDVVRVFVGPYGDPRAIIRIGSDGSVDDELGVLGGSLDARIERSDDRWTALLRLPEVVIPRRGPLLLGLERIDATGARSSWPRPLLPGARRPARIAIDLGAWDGGFVGGGASE